MTAVLIWKRGMRLAHTLYAAIEAAGLGETEAGIKIRKCALAVPSLLDESFNDFRSSDPFASLEQAENCIANMKLVLSAAPLAGALDPSDLALLLEEIDSLSCALDLYRGRLEHQEKTPA